MRSASSSIWTVICAVWIWQITSASAYFIIQEPQKNTQWVNNAVNVITWTKGLRDDIFGFDLEMASISKNGISLIARNVPASPTNINLMLQDVPPGDDYYIIFLNSTHGGIYASSQKFSILAPSATPSSTPPSPATGVPTVTVSGAPNPTLAFATTFAALPGSAISLFTSTQSNALLLMLLGCASSALLTLTL